VQAPGNSAGNAAGSAAPKVTVIIPTHNRAGFLGRCLDSLVAQSFTDFEVVVCDDGSTDESGAVAESYKRKLNLSYHWAENFGGPARPRNAGLGMARGAYLAFLDSDDWWKPSKLAESVRRLDAGADLVYHDLLIVRSSRQKLLWRRVRTRALTVPAFDDLLTNGPALCNSSVVLRREILERVGGFSEDPTLIAWEDYDAWLRIAKVTERFERIDESLGFYWAASGSLSSPRRLISNLERFRQLYWQPEGAASSLPAWCHYSLGLAHYGSGDYPAALVHLRNTQLARLSIVKRLKASSIAAVAILRLALGSGKRRAPTN
jgi:glycosyltransferase involved in cell wall biosynthesis